MFESLRKNPFVRKLVQLKIFFLINCSLWRNFKNYESKRSEIFRDEEDIRGKCVVVTGGVAIEHLFRKNSKF